MNRAQRRAQAKATPAYKRGKTVEDKIKAFYKNGITAADLQENFEKGYNAGFKDAVPATYEHIYAAVILACRRDLGFGKKRCARLLNHIDDIVTEHLSSREAIEQVWQEVGLELNFSAGIERIEDRA